MQKIINDNKLDFDDVLIVPQRSTLTSRSDIQLERTFQFYHSPRTWTGIPIICSNMGFCSFELAKSLADNKMVACLHKYHSVDLLVDFFNDNPHLVDYVWISIGYKKTDFDNLLSFYEKTKIQPNICIDVPNGHMDVFIKYCKKVREHFPESIIIAGNVTNTSSTQELLIYGGIDIVKVGVGGGSACLTRFVTGCGYPQLSTCLDNSYVAHGLDSGPKKLGLICSDGGHKHSGDVCKALCAGSDFVMLGGYFAGTDECSGEWKLEYEANKAGIASEFWQPHDPGYPTKTRKTEFSYYGMSTHHAQELYEHNKKDYRASEGTKITVKAKGPIKNLVQELLGGIRSCCCYIGSKSIKNMHKCGQFCKVNSVHNNKNPTFGI
jgi:GMP reductase